MSTVHRGRNKTNWFQWTWNCELPRGRYCAFPKRGRNFRAFTVRCNFQFKWPFLPLFFCRFPPFYVRVLAFLVVCAHCPSMRTVCQCAIITFHDFTQQVLHIYIIYQNPTRNWIGKYLFVECNYALYDRAWHWNISRIEYYKERRLEWSILRILMWWMLLFIILYKFFTKIWFRYNFVLTYFLCLSTSFVKLIITNLFYNLFFNLS